MPPWISPPRPPPPKAGWVYEPDTDWESRPTLSEEQESGELTYVDIDEFLATFSVSEQPSILANSVSLSMLGRGIT